MVFCGLGVLALFALFFCTFLGGVVLLGPPNPLGYQCSKKEGGVKHGVCWW